MSAPEATGDERQWLQRVERDPSDVAAWFQLGVVRHRAARLDAALAAFGEALRMQPESVQALAAQSAVLLDAGRVREALVACRRALAVSDDPQRHANLGVALEAAGEPDAALAAYEAALARDPGMAHAGLNRGVLLARLGRRDEALASHEQVLSRHPDLVAAHVARADVLIALERPAEALLAAERALAVDPLHPFAHIERGLALALLGHVEAGQQALDRASEISPDAAREFLSASQPLPDTARPRLVALHIYLDVAYARIERCDWGDLAAYVRRFRELARCGEPLDPAVTPLAYHVLALPLDAVEQAHIAQQVAAGYAAGAAVAASAAPRTAPSARRVRVGYVSPDFREHLNGYLALPLFRYAGRDRVEAFAYALNADDGSANYRTIRTAAEHFVDLSNADDAQAAQRIREDAIEVLVDLAGYTHGARPGILARRPAPAQASYLGFPGTMGADFMDYRVSDALATPPASQALWSERLVLLPDSFYLYDPDDRPGAVPVSRAEYGLPGDGVVLCALHQGYKIEPGIFACWMRILRQVPNAVLWLPGRDARAARNLAGAAEAAGVAAQRLAFAPFEARARYFSRYALADLLLDTPLFNAMTSACDALLMGLPMLTCAGPVFQSRVGASLLHAAGMSELVTHSLDDYEALAAELAHDRDRLASLRDRLRREIAHSPLFDARARLRELEWAWCRMAAQRAGAGLPPAGFDVPRQAPRPAWF